MYLKYKDIWMKNQLSDAGEDLLTTLFFDLIYSHFL